MGIFLTAIKNYNMHKYVRNILNKKNGAWVNKLEYD